MALASLCWMMAGCADEIVDRGGGKGTGRLILAGIDVESVVGDIQTKASLEPDAIPEAGDLTLTIVKADNPEEVVKTLPAGASDCFLPAGSYKVRATYGDEVAMSATPYFFGESEAVTITTGANQSVKLTASLACAVLRPVIAPELEAQYESYSLKVTESAAGKDTRVATLENGKDFFVRGGEGHTYTLLLEGTNKLGESASHTWKYENLVVRTRYTINCNPDLPAFTLPTQPEGNVWSKFIYITPMTADNMTAHPEMAEKVINQVVYEATADNGATWIPSEKTPDGRYVIKGLTPSTPYTLRSRFCGVTSSDIQTVTTESAQQVENGDMEQYTTGISMTLYGLRGTMYCYHFGKWATRNEQTTAGADKVEITNTSAVQWKYCSNTRPITENNTQMAEISTLAFYNKSCGVTIWDTEGGWFSKSILEEVRKDGTVYTGLLFTGEYDKETSNPKLGISHSARPLSLSFDLSYLPVQGDLCLVYAKLLNDQNQVIAGTNEFQVGQQLLTRQTLKLNYTDYTQKANQIIIYFQSGTDVDISKMSVIDGSGPSPRSTSRIVGSVLKIDNVTLNYDYE